MSSFSLPSATRPLLLHASAARAESGPCALFDGTTAIADPDASDSGNVELGARFSVDTPASGAYWLTKVRYYRAPNRPINTNRVNVYDSSGADAHARQPRRRGRGERGRRRSARRAAAADRRQDLHRQLLRADRPSRCG